MAVTDLDRTRLRASDEAETSWRGGRAGLLLGAGVAAAAALLTWLYIHVFNHLPDLGALQPSAIVHILINVLCITVTWMTAWRTRGHLEHKVARTLSTAILSYGAFLLLILAGRWFFSRPTLLTSYAVASLGGLAIVTLKHRLSAHRIAVIAPAGQGTPQYVPGDLITHPARDLRDYDFLLVTFTEAVSAEWAAALSRAMLAGAKVRHIGEYEEEVRGAVALDHFDLDHVSHSGIASYATAKRLLDIGTVLFFLPIATLAFAMGALMVLITMGRPVFFVQDRVGLGGKVFRMWKLRTMRNARRATDICATAPNDQRITRVGAFLRRFRIDELPQLWHVLKGEMSLIGPRPEQPALAVQYETDLPAFAYRHLVRPGITGWAQVRAPYAANLSETRTKLAYDLYYVKRLSLLLDLQIIARTFWTLSMGGGVR